MRGSKATFGKLSLEESASTPFHEWMPPMSGQSGTDRLDEAIMTAIDLVADRAKSGDVGKVEVPFRRLLSEDDRANLREYAELAGVDITIFPDHIDVEATAEHL
ncbi:hypothetical protein BH09CHL1_BH09CHL1_09450 [soil metagenome]